MRLIEHGIIHAAGIDVPRMHLISRLSIPFFEMASLLSGRIRVSVYHPQNSARQNSLDDRCQGSRALSKQIEEWSHDQYRTSMPNAHIIVKGAMSESIESKMLGSSDLFTPIPGTDAIRSTVLRSGSSIASTSSVRSAFAVASSTFSTSTSSK